MLGAAVGAYAWDNSRSDEIAEGITIGGVDVSGMTGDEARKVVDAKLVEPLQKHVTVDFEGVKYKLSPERLEVSSMSTGWPIARSRRARRAAFRCGSSAMPPGRGRRRHLAAAQLLEQGPERVHRQGRGRGQPRPDRRLDRADGYLAQPGRGQDGVAVVEDKLRAKLESAVQSPTERRRAAGRAGEARRSRPTSWRRSILTYLTVNRSTFELTCGRTSSSRRRTRSRSAPRASTLRPASTTSRTRPSTRPGASPTPTGPRPRRHGRPGGVPENLLKERWMGIFDGAGIHGTDDVASLGTAASHGCGCRSLMDRALRPGRRRHADLHRLATGFGGYRVLGSLRRGGGVTAPAAKSPDGHGC